MDSAMPAMSMTISPTEKFFMAGETMVRLWTGLTRDGIEVVVLVASVALPSGGPMPDLKPIPPPVPDWEPRTREAIGRIWKLAGGLLPEEVEAFATAMDLIVTSGLPLDVRRAVVPDFLSGLGMVKRDDA